MLWTLLSIVVAFAELVAFMSADWLIGKAKTRGAGAEPAGTDSEPYYLGILCIRTPGMQQVPRDTLCGTYAKSFGEIASGFWQATAIFLAMGIFILSVVALVSVFSMCVQSIMKKSIFNVCGLLQGIAGECWVREEPELRTPGTGCPPLLKRAGGQGPFPLPGVTPSAVPGSQSSIACHSSLPVSFGAELLGFV